MKKLSWLMSEEEKAKVINTRMKRAVMALYNACNKSYYENSCKGCPFNVLMGCNLYGHPIEWNDKIKELKSK